MADEDPIGDTIVDLLQRATLPFDQPSGGATGTAFLYNHLIGSTPDHDRVMEFLITAADATQTEVGQFWLRPDMIEPPGSASDSLLMMQFADSGLPRMGLTRFEDVEEISGEPTLAYILGHGVDGSERPLILVRGVVARDPDGVIRWPGDVPEGLVGAPVFSTRLIGDGDIKVVCLGVVLPGARNNVIATFDSIRTAIASTIPSGLG